MSIEMANNKRPKLCRQTESMKKKNMFIFTKDSVPVRVLSNLSHLLLIIHLSPFSHFFGIETVPIVVGFGNGMFLPLWQNYRRVYASILLARIAADLIV